MTISPRVSFAEREPVIEQLKRAYAEGRLEDAELDLRVGLALTVKTRLEIESLLADLPTPTFTAANIAASAPNVGDRLLVARVDGLRTATPLAWNFKLTVLTAIVATAVIAIITYFSAALIAAGMSVHLIK